MAASRFFCPTPSQDTETPARCMDAKMCGMLLFTLVGLFGLGLSVWRAMTYHDLNADVNYTQRLETMIQAIVAGGGGILFTIVGAYGLIQELADIYHTHHQGDEQRLLLAEPQRNYSEP